MTPERAVAERNAVNHPFAYLVCHPLDEGNYLASWVAMPQSWGSVPNMNQLGHPATTGLAAIINELRDERGMSVRALATKARIPRTTLERSLFAGRPLPTNELFNVADALGVLPEDLVAAARAAA